MLIGRDDLLALGTRRVDAARAGAGHLLFLAGEAGIGKSRLLGAVAREASRQGMRVVRGGADPRDIELPGGMLLDLGHALAASSTDATTGTAILDRLASTDAAGDPHRRRRLLVLDAADRLAGLATPVTTPVMLALEDLHWADDLTLEVLARLAASLPTRPMLVVGTYRSDELYPRVPMREWRARLLTQRLAEEVRLARLSLDETGAMASLLLADPLPPPRRLVESLHASSDGIPLHVEEILAATDGGAAADGMPVPDTLTDAILWRRAGLRDATADIADAAAVMGRSFDVDLLSSVAGHPSDEVAAAVDELEARYFLVRASNLGWFAFRHALIRDALEAAVPLARRRALHERVARHVARRGELAEEAFLSAHFEAAGLSDEAFAHARSAASRAATMSSHREALDLYRRAIRCAPELPMGDRAALLAARAAEEASTDDNEAAAASYAEARELYLAAGMLAEGAALVPPLVAARHLLGDDLETRVALLEAGLAESEAGAAPVAPRARLFAGLAAAYMLDRRLDEAMRHGDRAIALAAEAGNEGTELHAIATLGPVLVFAGRMDEGWARLEEAVARARQGRLEAEAARAYRMIGSSASVLVEYERAERWLRDGIEYAERTEQWNHRHYMASHLGHVLWATGRPEEASSVTEHALADGRGGITTRITALHVRGYLALGRGDWTEAETTLGEARRLGDEMGELQRYSPAIWGLAEAARLQGRFDEAVALSDEGRRASQGVLDAAYLFPFLVTGTHARLGSGDPQGARAWVEDVAGQLLHRSIPGTLPAIDHARGLLHLAEGATGRARRELAAARAAWLERGRTWEGCGATIDLARCAMRANRPAEAASLVADALALAERIGAASLAQEARTLDATLRARGISDEPWAPLTAREFEVARLIAAGRTNREIAAELAIAPKTVDSHVEHILGRLGAERRTEIATWVAGVLPR